MSIARISSQDYANNTATLKNTDMYEILNKLNSVDFWYCEYSFLFVCLYILFVIPHFVSRNCVAVIFYQMNILTRFLILLLNCLFFFLVCHKCHIFHGSFLTEYCLYRGSLFYTPRKTKNDSMVQDSKSFLFFQVFHQQ